MTDPVKAIRLEPAHARDALACADIFNRFVDETEWMPRVHDRDDVARFYSTVMLPERDVTVARADEGVVAFIAIERGHDHVAALYVRNDWRNVGLGRRLLAAARQRCPDGFQLWTFQRNVAAQRFYAANGLYEVRRTDGDNEESLPDILLEWRPDR
jgi:GNAT superfamily N-acetyltransferase